MFLVAVFVALGWHDSCQAVIQRVARVTTIGGITTTNMVAYTAPHTFQVVIQPETFSDIVLAGLQYPPMLALAIALIALAVCALIVLPQRIDRWWHSWHLHRVNTHQHKFA